MFRMLSLLLVSGLVFAADPVVGTWKMNVAKSKFSPGPAPKGNTVTYAEEDGWLVIKAVGATADGTPTMRNNRLKYDGKEYPYESPYGKGTIRAKKTGERQTMNTITLDGGGTITQHGVLSADGKTRTLTATGKNAKGEPVNTTIVYERQ